MTLKEARKRLERRLDWLKARTEVRKSKKVESTWDEAEAAALKIAIELLDAQIVKNLALTLKNK